MAEQGQREWRSKVDEELSDLKAATKTLTSVVDTLVNRISSFETKLDNVAHGPNIAQWSGWGVGIGGLLWILITGQMAGIENGANAERESLRAQNLLTEKRLEKANDRLLERFLWMGQMEEKFVRMDMHTQGMWEEFVKLRDELGRRTATLAELKSANVYQAATNERQQDRLDKIDESASIDKDELEREALQEIRREIRTLDGRIEQRLLRMEQGVRNDFLTRKDLE